MSDKTELKDKEQVDTSAVVTPDPKKELKNYRYGDAVIKCSCGHTTHIKHPEFINVEVGLTLPPLYTTNQHFLGLACEKCKAALTFQLIESLQSPAYDFTPSSKYDMPEEIKVEWTSKTDSLVKSEVFVATLTDNPDDKPDFKSQGEVTEQTFTLKTKEDTNYFVRVENTYSEGVNKDKALISENLFLSTKAAPSVPEQPEATDEAVEDAEVIEEV